MSLRKNYLPGFLPWDYESVPLSRHTDVAEFIASVIQFLEENGFHGSFDLLPVVSFDEQSKITSRVKKALKRLGIFPHFVRKIGEPREKQISDIEIRKRIKEWYNGHLDNKTRGVLGLMAADGGYIPQLLQIQNEGGFEIVIINRPGVATHSFYTVLSQFPVITDSVAMVQRYQNSAALASGSGSRSGGNRFGGNGGRGWGGRDQGGYGRGGRDQGGYGRGGREQGGYGWGGRDQGGYGWGGRDQGGYGWGGRDQGGYGWGGRDQGGYGWGGRDQGGYGWGGRDQGGYGQHQASEYCGPLTITGESAAIQPFPSGSPESLLVEFGKIFDNLITHLSSEEHHELQLAWTTVPVPSHPPVAPTAMLSDLLRMSSGHCLDAQLTEENLEAVLLVGSKAVTSVYWDMEMCPVPLGCAPRRISPIGAVEDVPYDILREIYPSGISVPYGDTSVSRGLSLEKKIEALESLAGQGEFNSGKSTVINALLGKRYLKEGVVPTTNEITFLCYSDLESEEQQRCQTHPDGQYVCYLPAPILKDLPAVLIVLYADLHISLCLSGCVSPLEEAISFVKENTRKLLNTENVILYPVSARSALEAKLSTASLVGRDDLEVSDPGGDTSSPCVTENDGKVTEASGQVSPPTGCVKKLPSRRAGVNKEPVKRGGVKKETARRCETAVKNKKDDEAKKDDGDNIEMLKIFILEQHLETVKTLKAEIHNCFAGLTKCACGGLQSPKNHTTLHQKVGKSDVQVINLEVGKTVTDNKKWKRTEVETEEGVCTKEVESIGNSYNRIRWDKPYPLATTKEGRPETTTDATERWEKTANEASDTEGGQATKEGLPETTTDATERWEKTANEATDTVGGQVEGVHVEGGQATEMEGRPETATDASEGWEKSANEATETEGGQEMEFENEWGSGDDSPFAEHNALTILPSGLEDGNEAMITEPVTDEIDTCGEGEVNNSSSPQTPEELVTKSKRVPRASIFVKGGECTGDAKLKALITSKRKTPDYHPISRANLEEYDEFKNMLEENEEMSYTIVTKHTITNRHFLDIAEAQNPLKTEHMQVIMSMLWRRREDVYTRGRAVFIDTWFLTLLKKKYTEFKGYKKKLKFNWGVNVRAIVTGKSKGRLPTTVLKNVYLVYIPMNWSTTLWVGLVINLMQGTIEVLDPLIDASSDEEVMSLMAPVVEMIPWLVKDAIAKEYTQKFSTKPLTWKRVAGLYQNKRGGDSGPVAAKFLEMHAYGLSTDDMGKITDEKVDEFEEDVRDRCICSVHREW
ncbi:Ulp1 protease family C-terminal catalytic domain [Arabidopsis suecica]|uniref:Ulp1 protease family C-terminal catalytic domain n=1 Tax=Arabidopsis suecica TaxID=45249 RepID=A0A8T2BQL4_ARASU|nr:Ulp1 protease family C-terminal catalytic domain [Arabidopsis suecica]